MCGSNAMIAIAKGRTECRGAQIGQGIRSPESGMKRLMAMRLTEAKLAGIGKRRRIRLQ